MSDHFEDDVFIADPDASQDEEFLPEPPGWPKVIGIISIVLGALGITCGFCGMLTSAFMPQFMSSMTSGQDSGPLPPNMQLDALMIGLYLLSVVGALLLLIAGITTTLRKPVGRALHLAYGVLGVISAIVSVVFQLNMHQRMMQFKADNPDSPYVQGYGDSSLFIALGFIIVLGFVWPVFCLVWFGLIKRSPDDITGGLIEPAA